MGMEGPSPTQRKRMEHQHYLVLHFFLSVKFVFLTETNVRGRKYASEEAESPSVVILTSHWKREQLVNRKKKNLYVSSKIMTFPANSVEEGCFCWCLNSAALCGLVPAWLQKPRSGAWSCFCRAVHEPWQP